jgi:large subunit ribosomal protein L18
MLNKRIKRHKRIRGKISGTSEVPRLSVFRSNQHLSVQLIDDENKRTLLGMHTKSLKMTGSDKSTQAKELGNKFAKEIQRLKEVKSIKFDRGGYRYHGRVRALADSLRENGVKF